MRIRSPAPLAVTFAVVFGAACGSGGRNAPPAVGPVNVPSASASGASAGSVSPPPSGLPPKAPMPPPGVVGSRKARKKGDPALASCSSGLRAAARDPGDQVKRLGEACAAPSRMHAMGAPLRGQQGERDAHQEHRFHADANKCYRVYVATDEGVRESVVVLRDSAGDIIAESPAPVLPEDGAICFSASDDVTLLVSVGSGKGAYVAQVWSD